MIILICLSSCDDPGEKQYPFVLKMVCRDGLYCCRCPWYRYVTHVYNPPIAKETTVAQHGGNNSNKNHLDLHFEAT